MIDLIVIRTTLKEVKSISKVWYVSFHVILKTTEKITSIFVLNCK